MVRESETSRVWAVWIYSWTFGFVFVQDPKQKSIMEMFQRSFSADDLDEALLMEAANDWEEEASTWKPADSVSNQ